MATRTFASLVPRLAASVPGCPNPTIIQYVRDAAIRVCERTLAWRHAQPVFTLLPGVHEYIYEKPATTAVHAVFGGVLNDVPLPWLTLEQALRRYPEWADLYSGEDPLSVWGLTQSGTFNTSAYNEVPFNENVGFILPDAVVAKASEPRILTQLTPDKYIVLPLPDNTRPYALRLFYALKPSRGATGMDEAIFDELEEAIVHSALQQLLVLPGVTWSDRELAAYHAKQALREIGERRARANMGAGRGVLVATAPKFA